MEKFAEDKLQLNLQLNDKGIYECRGRVQGDYPIYIPDRDILAEKLVAHMHMETLHGGVNLTMTKISQRYWIPRLRRLTKRVTRSCHGCKRFRVQAYPDPPTADLPTERTTGSTPFKVIGVDYPGPIRYLGKTKKERKAYVALDLLPDQSTTEFLHSLKRFIARKGRPEKIFSDNGKTFIAAASWLKRVRNDEKLNDYLAKHEIKWKFNLSRAPWWGGQFERLVGVMKQALYKTIGHGNLRWRELESYVEDDVKMPILTPNAMQFGQPTRNEFYTLEKL